MSWEGLRKEPTAGEGGVLTFEMLERAREAWKHYGCEPELELVSGAELERRRTRHRLHGVPMHVPSRMAWPAQPQEK